MASKIVRKVSLIPGQTSKVVVDAPQIAAAAEPGNFVILRVTEDGERIPLTIADTDKEAGTITLVYLVMGKTTALLEALSEGDFIADLCGPLGTPTHIEKVDGPVICVGGGTGIAAMHHIAKGHHRAGNYVVAIIGARSKNLLLYYDELSAFCHEVLVSTDDGSFGHKGLVTEILKERLDSDKNIAEVIAVGPVPMMNAVAQTTRPYGVKTTVSLNSIMVDGIGMCGACRVTVGGEVKFTCVDGPEFDGHLVDFAELRQRLSTFRNFERKSHDDYCKCMENPEAFKKPKVFKKRVPMPCQPPDERVQNFTEVALGYSPGQAREEAKRCLQCKRPACVKGCPVEVDIPGFVGALAAGKLDEAYTIIKRTNSLPAVCGRVCPQENQCEGKCVLSSRGQPVAIGRLERFVADSYLASSACQSLIGGDAACAIPDPALKVACIGSGPASLTVAGYLAAKGISVTVFEALHEVGGVLVYGIPEFRLPKDEIVGAEVAVLKTLGVEFKTNWVGGKTIQVADLLEQGYKAVFIGVGAGLPKFLGIPGENLMGVFSANEYLTRINLGRAYEESADTPGCPGAHVTVFGGGNVAMDAARTALRLGAESVRIVYRRTRDEMPARLEELEHAEDEGVRLELLSAPLRFIGDENGRLTGVELERMELGEPDASGRRSPRPIPGSAYILPTDLAVVAVGTNANPVLLNATKGLKLNKRGYIEADENGETSIPNVFAGGDIVSGAATVIMAMGAGRVAAKEIARRLGRD